MKPRNMRPPGLGRSALGRSTLRIPNIPMEWMDPLSWRLPSGKALAEFWLQSGFLAPLMLEGSAIRRRKADVLPADQAVAGASSAITAKKEEKAPERSGTFREIV